MKFIGIDVSKDKLDCGFVRDPAKGKVKTRVFRNKAADFAALQAWACKQTGLPLPELHFVIEATGVYHLAVAQALYEAGARVSVVNPALVKRFAESEGRRSKTDRRDSLVLARYGQAHHPRLWRPEPEHVRVLKALLGRLNALEKDIQREKNRLEKVQAASDPAEVTASIQHMLEHLQAEQKRLQKQINAHIRRHPDLAAVRKLLASIPGIGPVMSRLLLAVFCSHDFDSAKQLAAYAGLIPIHHQSGTYLGRSRISKAGNALLRAKLYMAAVSATKHNPLIRQHYQRLLQQGKCKMVALVAAMRKLLHICFGVVKNQKPFQAVPQLQG
jgi:transposase